MDSIECHKCGNCYKQLGQHWGNGCQEPKMNYKQNQIATGAMMGDGSMCGPDKSRQFRLCNTNKEFLEWYDNKMGILTTGVKVGREPKEHAANQKRSKGSEFNPENYQTSYYVSTRTLSCFRKFDGWYDEGRKKFPENLTLTPLMAKLWYVSDGTLINKEYEREYVRITATNEIVHHNRGDFITNLFADVGFDATIVSESIKLYKDSSQEFFQWIGNPVPGFEYKWPSVE